MPGLLQTAEYAEALTAISVGTGSGSRRWSGCGCSASPSSRAAEAPPRQYFVLDEAVIRRHVGVAKDPAIMPGQLMHIVSRARDDDRITVRVIPFGEGRACRIVRAIYSA